MGILMNIRAATGDQRLLAGGHFALQFVEKVHKEDHVALGLLGFRRLDWHPCGDAFAIGCNVIIDRSNPSIRDPLLGPHPAEPNH
jgi:hypothetical protein